MATQRPQLPVAPAHRVLMAAPRRPIAPPVQRRANALTPFLQVAPVAILIIGLLLPVEVRVNLAGQTLYAYRIAWMLVAPWLIFQILAGRFKFRFIDAMVGLASLWVVISFAVLDGVAKGLPAGVALGLDVLMPYLITRYTIRSTRDFMLLLIMLAPIALGIAALMVLESVTQTRFIRAAAASISGRRPAGSLKRQARSGQWRKTSCPTWRTPSRSNPAPWPGFLLGPMGAPHHGHLRRTIL